ncbi:hypothetical protein H6F78_11710 [Coleofasciculus sp. FACHB-64]|nr:MULTISPECIES: hypothetical protein [unclassified Coleofasciculus]MBD1838056.1 hypothetical protein [Coleofasciculus sp. FACHB-501]MBD2046250.1 hypothetical protein [Coleofasciculus sp. FACHB-64]
MQKDNHSEAECWLNRVQHSSDSQASVKDATQPLVERLKFMVERLS